VGIELAHQGGLVRCLPGCNGRLHDGATRPSCPMNIIYSTLQYVK
jgi:hypothetical protein